MLHLLQSHSSSHYRRRACRSTTSHSHRQRTGLLGPPSARAGDAKEKKNRLHRDPRVAALKKTREPGGDSMELRGDSSETGSVGAAPGIIFMPSTPDFFGDSLSKPHFTIDWGQGSVETARCASAQRVAAAFYSFDTELQEVSPVPWPSTRIIQLPLPLLTQRQICYPDL
jgi:hypothetical protein